MPFDLTARIHLDGRSVGTGLARMKSQVGAAMGSIRGQIGAAFGTAAVTAAIKKTVEYGSRIHDLAKATGISTKRLQEFEYAAEQSGSSVDGVARALRGLSKAREDALAGDPQKVAAFKDLGIDEAALKGQSLEESFLQIARTVQSTDFGAGEIALIEKVLGRSAMELLPAFKDGFADGVAEADRLGIAIEEKVINNLDKLGDQLDKLSAQMRGPFATALMGVVGLANKLFAHLGRGAEFWSSLINVPVQMFRDVTGANKGVSGSDIGTGNAMKEVFRNFWNGVTFGSLDPKDTETTSPAPGKKAATIVPRSAGGRARALREASDSFVRDDLARIGGFTGSAGTTDRILERIASSAEETAENTKPGSEGGLP